MKLFYHHDMEYVLTEVEKLQHANQFATALINREWNTFRAMISDDVSWSSLSEKGIPLRASGADAVTSMAREATACKKIPSIEKHLFSVHGITLLIRCIQNDTSHVAYKAVVLSFSFSKISSIDIYRSDYSINALSDVIQRSSLSDHEVAIGGYHKLGATFLTSLKNRDWRLMGSILADDVTWTLPGKNLLSRKAIGIDAVLTRAKQLRNFDVGVNVNGILKGTRGVVLSLHNTASRGELVLDEHVAIVCDITDGKIQKITTHLHDVDGINAFFVDGVV